MRKILLKTLIGILILSCSNQNTKKENKIRNEEKNLAINSVSNNYQETEILKMIDSYQEIYLIQRDAKCGEWGGDKEQIRVYRNHPNEKILLDYKKLIIDCDDPYNQKENARIIEKDKIESNREILVLVEKSIQNLINQKLSNDQVIAHSGIANYVISKDSTLIIKDYPSYQWPVFKKLIRMVKEK